MPSTHVPSTTVTRAITDYPRTQIDRSQGRSVVMSLHGIVASEHPLAAQAGAMILAAGGHAVDAAIAANAVMGAVAPMMNGVGGDLFAIVYDANSGGVQGVNASGWTPAGLTLPVLEALGAKAMPQTGIHSVTVPGAVAGWSLLRDRYGRKSWPEILQAAMTAATHGVPVAELTAAEWASAEPLLRAHRQASATYLPNGRVPAAGEPFRNPDLAWTYRQIADHGADAFYGGEIALRLLACSEQHQGLLTAADLGEYTAEWVEPLSTTYRGWTVYELPPNGQGIAALLMLNMMECFSLRQLGHHSVESLHLLIEAKKLAYADMSRLVGDPRFVATPVVELLSKGYAQQRAGLIDPVAARPRTTSGLAPFGGDTTYLSVVDRDGNMVSLIQSNFANFGSGLVPPGTGFALQNRGGLFTLDRRHPNVVAPRKRPLHTIIPGFMSGHGRQIAFGIMGGWNQAQAHAQFVSNVVDHEMNIQAALEAPRFNKLTFDGCDVLMEDRVPASVRSELAARGHVIDVLGSFSSLVGGGQSVAHETLSGVNHGGSDPRKDGAAVPEPLDAPTQLSPAPPLF